MNRQAKEHLDKIHKDRAIEVLSNEEWIKELEKIIMEEYGYNGPIDRSDLLEAMKGLDVFIAGSVQ